MYSNQERLDFFLCYVKNNRSYVLAVREYLENYPDRRIPDRKFVLRVENDIRNHGVVKFKKRNRPNIVLTPDTQLNIALYYEESPENSLNDARRDLTIARSTIFDCMKLNHYKPYKFAKLQHLEPNDKQSRLEFCMNILDRHFETNMFHNILWTDEASFTTAGIYNRKNIHYWSQQNQKKIKTIKHQGRQSVHVWCGIYRNQIKGPFFLDRNLNRQRFLNLLQEDVLPMLAADGEVDHIFFQMDGAPCHTGEEVATFLNNHFAGIIGPRENLPWPPRSPDLTPLDYFLWGALKDRVYKNRSHNVEELKERIREGINYLNQSGSVGNAIRKLEQIYTTCIAQDGGHVEHLR